ncbi:MAG: G-D-S-L family lipolytic protein [Chitinophagaceae bacterium]|nr:G-D-S-L family lipolytic protein [Chitinophagaceae bacterium]
MRSLHLLLLLVCSICLLHSCSTKSDRPFYDEIQAFKNSDKQNFPPANAILFVGSSSFRLWKDINTYFPGYTIINRGFGGSGLNDLINYEDDIISPYNPKQVVIYCGENDIAAGNVTATDVLQRFTELFNMIRKDLPQANIVYVSVKPSPSREKYMHVMEDANIMIRQFLSSYPETVYVDVYHPMLDREGKPRPELFKEDSLHMNEKGYAIWRDAITPHLVK